MHWLSMLSGAHGRARDPDQPAVRPLYRLIHGKERTMTENNADDKDVKVYSLSTCSHCKATKKLLDECTIKFEFVDVDMLEGEERKAMVEEVKKVNERCSFPTIIIGEQVIVGYKEKAIKEALGL
jgi:glutaredoxin